MTAAALLDRLDGVRQTGPDRWLARCPAHDDRRPSLAVRELDDGRVLVHDFAGCDVADVVAAVGLELDVLFPDRAGDHRQRGERRPFPAADILRMIAFEALLVATAASALANGAGLAEDDRKRVLLAAERIQAGLDAGGIHA
jgi:hypothetical protein